MGLPVRKRVTMDIADEFYVDGLSVNEDSSELRESNYTKIGFSASLLVESSRSQSRICVSLRNR